MRALAVSIAVALALPLLASAAGGLDPSFGSGGQVRTDFGAEDVSEALAVQNDGKIVAVGVMQEGATPVTRFALARYAADGSLDGGFGSGGKVTTEFGGRDIARAVAVQPDGKIVAAGLGGSQLTADFAVARYNPDGSLDTSFGGAGKVVTAFGLVIAIAFDVVIQRDGKIVVAGYTRPYGPTASSPGDFALVRYNPNGTLDGSFDGDGRVTTDFAASDDRAWAVDLAPDGKIVAAGFQFDRVAGSSYIEVARYNADGSLDGSFDGDGRVHATQLQNSGAYDVVVQPDGKVVVAGFAGNLALVRFDPAGRFDPGFGSNGIATAAFGSRWAYARAVQRRPDGRFVVAGAVGPESASADQLDSAFAVAAFDRAGKLDRSFHGGTTSTDFAANALDEAWDVALQRNGALVAGGVTAQIQGSTVVGADFALARFVTPPLTKPKPKKVMLCHKGKTIKVPKSAVKKHRKHGDKLGACKKKKKKRR